ncbi:MAG: Cell division initiation protein DivIVA [uncultured Rubrobacteraceae bacterium]|uniref:Cell wall synthesis protein Wag31 n=1 Tax=uncultured Rubrobacteraceae bacterium TaxID=349277 RepID=A0A6J4RF25_9ACTN|nr:MAG: Cell division initiation protein DivIVA [uncultured Rubrobacteraceae bacterium]
MPIRPVDIRRKEFRNGFRGYDANQVDDFLDTVADEFERTYNENQRMREEVSGLRDRLQQFEDLEGSIRAALVHAEQAANDVRSSANREAEDVRQGARRDAELTMRDAQARSHQMLADSSSRIERAQDSYEALQEAKKGFANDFRHLLKTYMDMMESMEVSSAREIEASLRERLDTESIAVVHGAASQQEPTGAGDDEPAFGGHDAGDVEDPGATGRIEPETAATIEPEDAPETQETQATGPLAEGPSPEYAPADEQETQVLRPEGSAGDGPDDAESDGEGSGRVVWSTEPSDAEEPAAQGTASAEPVADETVAEEPETEPSTAGTADDAAAGEPRASEEVEREEPTLAEESSSHEFFDRESSGKQGGDSRISRASRFLRRRE